jgi:hypothetical protein
MTPLKAPIESILKIWNEECSKSNNSTTYSVEVNNRKKKYYTNKKDFFELEICELLFIAKESNENILLYRKELQVPKKVKGTPKYVVINNYEDQLYKYFLYECVGTFAVICSQTAKNQDYAPYDLEKDRMISHPSFKDTVIEVLEDGPFYKAGDQFDVFNELDGGWAVFTAHDVAAKNNGLAKIEGNKCKVVNSTIVPIEVVNIPKLIL